MGNRMKLLAALGLTALTPATVQAQVASDGGAKQCIEKVVDSEMGLRGSEQSVSAWVRVPKQVYASVAADLYAVSGKGDKFGSVRLAVMHDGVALGPVREEQGRGLLKLAFENGIMLEPGRQYRFVAKSEVDHKILRRLKLRISIDKGCS